MFPQFEYPAATPERQGIDRRGKAGRNWSLSRAVVNIESEVKALLKLIHPFLPRQIPFLQNFIGWISSIQSNKGLDIANQTQLVLSPPARPSGRYEADSKNSLTVCDRVSYVDHKSILLEWLLLLR